MYQKFFDNINNKNLIKDEDKILACVSGGADSMSMLHMLLKYFKGDKDRIEVCHFNHQLRGKEADRDEEFVRAFSMNHSLKFHCESKDIETLAKKDGLSIEECGRKYRHAFFKSIVGDDKNFKIALAHNLDDQAETVLMRIIRGTGIDGLTGIKEQDGQIIRPLLTISRSDIEDYIAKENITFVQDHTNFESEYTRNKLRNIFIPWIEKEINPSFKKSLLKLSDHASNDKLIKEDYVSRIFDSLVIENKNISILLDRNKLSDYKEFVQTELIRTAIERILGHLQGFDQVHYEEFLKILVADQGKEMTINNISLSIYSDNLLIKKVFPNQLCQPIFLKGKGKIVVNGFLINYDTKNKSLTLRKRKDGDRIFYRDKLRKLKDFFINRKISMVDRDYYPIVEFEGDILAVADIFLDRNKLNAEHIDINIDGGLEYGHF